MESTKTTKAKHEDLSRGAQAIFDQYLVFSGTQDQRKGSYRKRKGKAQLTTKDSDSRHRLKKDVNRERRSVEQQLRGLERDGIEFLQTSLGGEEERFHK